MTIAIIAETDLLLLFLWRMVKLSHHRSGIPVEFGVLEHLLVGIEFKAMQQMFFIHGGVGIWQIVHLLDSYMPIFLK
jgi:hypothetical protein